MQILVYGGFDFCRDTESSREFVKPEHVLIPVVIDW